MRKDEIIALKMMRPLHKALDKMPEGSAEQQANLMVNSIGICAAELVQLMREFDGEAGGNLTQQTVEGLKAHIDNAATWTPPRGH